MPESKRTQVLKWRNLELFAMLLRECDLFYQAVRDTWFECESSCATGILIPAVFAYMTDEAQSGTVLERDSIQKVAKVEFHVQSNGAFFGMVRNGTLDRLVYTRMVSGCKGGGALLYLALDSI